MARIPNLLDAKIELKNPVKEVRRALSNFDLMVSCKITVLCPDNCGFRMALFF